MVVRRGDPCTIKDCSKPVVGRGWCGMHYARWRKYGDPLYETHPYAWQAATCAVKDCTRPCHGRGLCSKHYDRVTQHGEITEPRERRFWAKVDKNGPVPEQRPGLGPCWLWTGYIAPVTGYGQYGGRKYGTQLVHRIAYQFLIGPIPERHHLDHLCRRRSCLRPDHLEPVLPRENIRRGDQGAFWGYTPDPIPARPTQLALAVCVNGCAKPIYKRNMCRPCYRKWLKDPNVERPSQRTPEQRFWAKVDKNGPIPAHRPELGPCWLWTAGINRGTGYGRFARRHGDGVDAHRFSYELAYGPIPEKQDVHHTCHRRSCIRPEHLLATTRSENLAMRKYRRSA